MRRRDNRRFNEAALSRVPCRHGARARDFTPQGDAQRPGSRKPGGLCDDGAEDRDHLADRTSGTNDGHRSGWRLRRSQIAEEPGVRLRFAGWRLPAGANLVAREHVARPVHRAVAQPSRDRSPEMPAGTAGQWGPRTGPAAGGLRLGGSAMRAAPRGHSAECSCVFVPRSTRSAHRPTGCSEVTARRGVRDRATRGRPPADPPRYRAPHPRRPPVAAPSPPSHRRVAARRGRCCRRRGRWLRSG